MGAGNGSGNGRLAQLSITDNPVCLCSEEALRSLLIHSVPSLTHFNDSDLSSPSFPDANAAAGEVKAVVSATASKEIDGSTLQRLQGVAVRIPKKSSDGTISSASRVARGNATYKAFPEHISYGAESHNKLLTECSKVGMSARTEEETFHGTFDDWMQKIILATIENARLGEQRHKT